MTASTMSQQSRRRVCGAQFVGDPGSTSPTRPASATAAGDAFVAGADAVEADEVGVIGEQAGDKGLVAGGVVAAFEGGENGEAGVFGRS
jgi:hypothetical protein